MNIILIAWLSIHNPQPLPPPRPIYEQRLVGLPGKIIEEEAEEEDTSKFFPDPIKTVGANAYGVLCRTKISRTGRKTVFNAKKQSKRRGNRNW